MDMPIFEAEPYAKLVSGLENHEVVVYDVESTGTDTSQDRIIQIAAIRIDENGQVLETFERFINQAYLWDNPKRYTAFPMRIYKNTAKNQP